MKRMKLLMLSVVLPAAFLLHGCGGPADEPAVEAGPQETEAVVEAAAPEPTPVPGETTADNMIGAEAEEKNTMIITVGEYQFTVSLEDNETVSELKEHLPLTLDMSELNGNEKYNYLPFSLPTESYAPGTIQAGDVMLYGDDCLVVFYKSFSTPYRYTRIGHIDDAADLQTAVGAGGVQMVFEN